MRHVMKVLKIGPASALLFICLIIIASLAFLTARLGDFSEKFGPNNIHVSNAGFGGDSEVTDRQDSFSGDTETLKALKQESSLVFKKPIGVIYKDKISKINVSESKPDAHFGHGHTTSKNSTNITVGNKETGIQASQKIQMRGKIQNPFPDTRIRYMRDQLIRAKLYLNLALANNDAQIARELRQRMREVGRSLGEANKDSDLSRRARERMRNMEHILLKAKRMYRHCPTKVKKLRAMVHSSEEQLQAHKTQGAFLTHLAVTSFSKGLHCLAMRLTVEYFALGPTEQEFPFKERLEDPRLLHYVIFSDNVVATSVVVNSTIFHAKEPQKVVIHIITDNLNHAAMKMWFLSNPPGNASIEVKNLEEIILPSINYSPIMKWVNAVKSGYPQTIVNNPASSENPTKSVYSDLNIFRSLDHLRFYLPEIFPKLEKVIVLDDDIVVQKDLSALWRIDMHGMVNGAVQLCGSALYRFDRYFNFSHPLIEKSFNSNSCTWAYGINVFDLQGWKMHNITGIYHKWQELNKEGQLWKFSSLPYLPLRMIIFYNNTYPISKSWLVQGLGHDRMLSQRDLEKASVIQYTGILKPWLEIGISKYRPYWKRYLKQDIEFLRDCNLVL